MAPAPATIRTDLQPGDIGYVVFLHGVLYAAENQLDHTFEGYVAAGLGEFARTFDAQNDRLWIAEIEKQIVGTIAIVGPRSEPANAAQLRWFLVHPRARGGGLGTRLVPGHTECLQSPWPMHYLNLATTPASTRYLV